MSGLFARGPWVWFPPEATGRQLVFGSTDPVGVPEPMIGLLPRRPRVRLAPEELLRVITFTELSVRIVFRCFSLFCFYNRMPSIISLSI